MRIFPSFIAFLIILAPLSPILAQVRVVKAEGSAVISHGAIGKARAYAIQDAIRQASLQSSSNVTTASMLSDNAIVLDSMRLRSAGNVTNVVVLDEWSDEDEMHVLIRADVQDTVNTVSETAPYRKKVGVVQSFVKDRRDIHDLPNIEIEYPRLLLKQLEVNGGIIGIDATQYILNVVDNNAYGGGGTPDKDEVIQLANALGVQFVVATIINDLAASYDFFGSTRNLSMELQVFDGITGVLVGRHQYQDKLIGGRSAYSASLENQMLEQTSIGKALSQIMDQQANTVKKDLDQLPLSARVIRSDGKQVYFDVGAASLVHVGDTLMAYKLTAAPLTSAVNGISYGTPETAVATVLVKKVQPLFSVGEVETDQINLSPGDIVRFGW